MNGMELREGDGNDGEAAREGDKMNVVWIVDSDKLPFYRAEVTPFCPGCCSFVVCTAQLGAPRSTYSAPD